MGKLFSLMTEEERAYHREYMKKYYQKNKEIIKLKAKKYRAENKEKIIKFREDNKERLISNRKSSRLARKEHYNEYSKKYYRTKPETALLYGARRRAKKYGIGISINTDDIRIPKVCPILNIKLEQAEDIQHSASPTLDRKRPELGYTKENVHVISYKANTMKSNATPEELRMFARWVLKTFPEESDGKT